MPSLIWCSLLDGVCVGTPCVRALALVRAHEPGC